MPPVDGCIDSHPGNTQEWSQQSLGHPWAGVPGPNLKAGLLAGGAGGDSRRLRLASWSDKGRQGGFYKGLCGTICASSGAEHSFIQF
jgi:hypothetical protein